MTIFYLPDLGEGLAEAEIREWYIKEGDTVTVDQPLVSMETAKAVVDVPSPYTGKIRKLHGKVGDVIATGAAFIEFDGEQPTKDKGTVVGSLEESSQILNEGNIIIGSANPKTESIKAMPAVRALAKQLQVDLAAVKATGPQGQITAEDVKRHAETSTPANKGNVENLHGVRRTMAIAMSQSHMEVVPVTIFDDADITDFTEQTDITVRLIQAIVSGVKAEPNLNAWYDGKAMERCVIPEVNLGLAMDTAEGLFVPVLKNVAVQSQDALREQINQYKQTVRARTVPPNDLQGASITLSNFGMFAGRYATPIIVPPQVAILGVGKIREAAIPLDGKIAVRRLMPLSLTFDHRAVTGGEATRFLAAVMKCLAEKK